MAFFSGYIGTIILALCVGTVFAIIIAVLLMIFVTPYALWVGAKNTKGEHMDKKKEPVSQSLRNATKLYKSWITKTEPTF